jgi:hypothetical protein
MQSRHLVPNATSAFNNFPKALSGAAPYDIPPLAERLRLSNAERRRSDMGTAGQDYDTP